MPSTKAFSGAALVDAIQSFMDKMEAKYRKTFLALIDGLASSPELTKLLNQIGSGKVISLTPDVLQSIEDVSFDATALRNLSRQAMSGAGKLTAQKVGFEGRFDLTNPRAIAYARTSAAEEVTRITRTVRQNLREIIADAVEGNATPNEVVRRIKNEVGLTPKYSAAVRNYRKQLLAQGRSSADANKMAQKYADRLLRQRAQTIARTEIAIATNVGQHEFWRQMQDAGELPTNTQRVWITAKDEKTCPICGPMDGQLAPIDGYWQTGSGPLSEAHAHPNCRCTSGLVFTTKLKKADPLGWEFWIISKHAEHNQKTHGNRGRTPIKIASQLLSKHLGAAHDQKTHGRRGVNYSRSGGGKFKGSKRQRSKFFLTGEDGSYYDYIDWDSDDHPVQQLLDLAATYLPIAREITLDADFDEVDVELFAESLDAFQAVSEMFPGLKIGGIAYESIRSNAGGSASRLFNTITINTRSILKGSSTDSFIAAYEASKDVGWHTPSDVPATQKTVIHEFGHIVRFTFAQKGVYAARHQLEKSVLKVIDPKYQVPDMEGYYPPGPFGDSQAPRSGYVTTPKRKQIIKDTVSTYASTNGDELFAELFAEAYTNDYANLRPAAKKFYDSMEIAWGTLSQAL